MNNDVDADHPAVQEIVQAVANHGWIIQSHEAVAVVRQVREYLDRYAQYQLRLPPDQRKDLRWEAERAIREILPDYVHTPDGDSPEIPDDLIEEIGEILADHSRGT